MAPKQTPPPRVHKSMRLRPVVVAAVEKRCEREGLTFSEGMERAAEAWAGSAN